ncbi:MAG: hypothetical protein MK008_09250 [Bdellovibrionales bacterium]|nr:hypothetical protein [Bdellovibrionales bacterium]
MKLLFILLVTQFSYSEIKVNNFNFIEGEYQLVKGDLPCIDGYVGWMEGQDSLSFMLGFNIIISNINEGKIVSKDRTVEDCKFDSTSKISKNIIESVENTICSNSTIKKIQNIKISRKNELLYTLKVYNDNKVVRDTKCVYKKQN